jgi:hypothetical protein
MPSYARKVEQLGDVVPDLEQEIKWWLARGVGPWLTLGPYTIKHTEYLGKPSPPRLILAFCQVGGVQLEIIQQLNDVPSPYSAFYAAGKSRLHHCAYYVESDYQKALADIVAAGETVQMKMWAGAEYTYVGLRSPMDPLLQQIDIDPDKEEAVREWIRDSSDQVCNVLELIEFTPNIRKLFARVTEAAATWDGTTNPVRHLVSPLESAAFEAQLMLDNLVGGFKERR